MSSLDFAALGIRPMSEVADQSVATRAAWVRELARAVRAQPQLPGHATNTEELFKLVDRGSDEYCAAVFAVLKITLDEHHRSDARTDAHLYGLQRAADRAELDAADALKAEHADDYETPRGGLTGPERRAMARGAYRRTGGGAP